MATKTEKAVKSAKTDKPKPLKQAGQESPTGGGTRMSGHDRPAVAEAGSKGGKHKH